MNKTMRAARLHQIGQPMVVDNIPVPELGSTDVLVEVKACGMVPNLRNVVANRKNRSMAKFPMIFGLDPAGIVVEVGSQVLNVRPGQRVYVNPVRSCDSCEMCSRGERTRCEYFTFNGYFGFGPKSPEVFDIYPYGGFCEYMSAPQYALVPLPDSITFEQAARFGYIGTGYGALKKAGASAGQTMLIDGISGTLGLGTTMLAIAMGISRIFGTGRNRGLLEKVKKIAPSRIEVHSLDDGSTGEWVRSHTNGQGVDFLISALGTGAPASTVLDSLRALRRGGRAVNVGAVTEPVPLNIHWMMDEQIELMGSAWFTSAQCREFAELAHAGLLDLSILEHRRFPLEKVNEALEEIQARDGGFSNYVIVP